MISRIIDFCARNRLIVLALVAVAAIYGWWSMKNVALDAIPDLSDTQVIVYSRWDRSPDIVEDQVTYPIVAAMLGAPKVRAVRGFSDFGYSFVYVIFEDGTDIYWARTRTLEYLSSVLQSLPAGSKTELGPDATGLGWIYQYVIEDSSGKYSLAELRSLQDWYLRYHLRSVPGVAEVSPIGGFGKQYQVNVDLSGRDPGSYVREAQEVVRSKVALPPGFAITWSGQYEAMERVNNRLMLVLPVTAFLILLLLYVNTRSTIKTMIVVLAVPFSAIGAIWFLYLLGYNMSIGVWVGLIALLGVDAETGVFMLLYLDLSYEQARKDGKLQTLADLREAIVHGAVKRIRPKFMTVATDFIGLVPILWATGTGSDVMKRIGAPLIGGVFTSFILELLVYPAIYEVWKWHFDLKKGRKIELETPELQEV
jgi:Cu/Ag efflux pump CusA